MHPIFTRSHQTESILSLFKTLSVGQRMSFADASRALPFNINATSSAYQSAKRIAVKECGIVVEGIHNFGFVRLSPSDIVKRGDKHMMSVRRRARRGGAELEIAIRQNLAREDMVKATERLARFRIIADTAAPTRAASNKPPTPEPPREAAGDSRTALRAM